MNRYFFGTPIVSAVFFSTVGILVGLDSGFASMMDDPDTKLSAIQGLISHSSGLLEGLSANDAAYAEAMHEHISHLG